MMERVPFVYAEKPEGKLKRQSLKQKLESKKNALSSSNRSSNRRKSGSAGKESAYNTGDLGSIPGLGRSPGEGNGNPLQYCCLENSIEREAWQATVHGVTELDMFERLTLSLSHI